MTKAKESYENEYVSEELRGKGVGFDRIRRITGYLVGSLDRFNTAKRTEVEDRIKHDVFEGQTEQTAHIA